jgi:hypothetical protein
MFWYIVHVLCMSTDHCSSFAWEKGKYCTYTVCVILYMYLSMVVIYAVLLYSNW